MQKQLVITLLVSALAVVPATANSEDLDLKQVHVVTRHGARFPLTKMPHNLDEGTPGTLTPKGVQQMRELGEWLHYEYSDELIPAYSPKTVYLESSAFDRTTVSANAIAAGLFPSSNHNVSKVLNVPVFTTKPINDITIRAYDKCFAFLESLQYEYKGNLWNEIESENRDLLLRLGTIHAFQQYANAEGLIPLTQVWNVYDAIVVAKSECEPDETAASCQSLDDPDVRNALTETEWTDLQIMVRESESLKYSSKGAAELVGYNLLKKIVNRMERSRSEVSVEEGSGNFYLYSAHYPVLMAVLKALGERGSFGDEYIPSYASALVMELYQNRVNGALSYQMYYRVGHPVDDSDGTVHTIHRLDKCPGSCAFNSLGGLVENWSEAEWCHRCGNDSADVCLQALAFDENSICGGNDNPGSEAFIGMLFGVVFGALGACFVTHLCRSSEVQGSSTVKRQAGSIEEAAVAGETEQEEEESPDRTIT